MWPFMRGPFPEMSSGSGDGRDTGQDRHAIDLISKSSIKAGETGKVMAQQQVPGGHVRGLTSSVGHTPARVLTSSASIGDVTTGVASVVVMSVPRSGLSTTAPGASLGSALSQNNPVARTSVPVVTATTTYHVPRGAAAVANIAAPRTGTTALGRSTPGAAITHASKWVHKTDGGSLVTGLRGLVPRAPTPAAAWLGAVSQAATAPGRPRAPAVASMGPYAQPRPPSLTVTRPTVPPPNRVQVPGEPIRPILTSSLQRHTIAQSQPISSAGGTPQGLGAQAHRSQQSTTPTSIAVSTQAGMGQRVVVAPVVSASQGIPGSIAGGVSRPVQAALLSNTSRPGGGPTVVRPPMGNVSPAPPRSGTGPSGGGGGLALTVGAQVRPRLTAAGPSRLTTTIPAPRLIGTSARPASAPATVIPANARLTSPGPQGPLLSIHPATVVVSTAPGLPLKPGTARAMGPKVISQPMHTPASIQITQVPVSAVQAGAKLPSSASTVMPQSPATRSVPSTAGAPLAVEHTGPVLSTYNFPTYVYDPSAGGGPSTYQVTGVVARPYTAPTGPSGAPGTATTYTVQTSAAAVLRPSGVVASSAPVKFNPVVVVDPSRSALPVHSSYIHEGLTTAPPETVPPPPPPPVVSKPSASPRPSILRKRDNEGSPMKIQKNLTPVLASLGAGSSNTVMTSGSTVIGPGPQSPPSPRRPDSRGGGGGNSSGGSTTISATSSPGLGEAPEEVSGKPDGVEDQTERPPPEMSPRKKPRKQQLTGNELHEPKCSDDEMEFISEEHVRKQIKEVPLTLLEPIEKAPTTLTPARRSGLTLLGSYRHGWKSRHNHYVRYSDVRPKDERRPTISELSSQKQVLQKIDGWKVFHLSTQMEELSELEQHVFEQLNSRVKLAEMKVSKDLDKECNRVNELLKGTLQRSKVTGDQLQEARSLVLKILEHKPRVAEVISRCANKRSQKKRDKS